MRRQIVRPIRRLGAIAGWNARWDMFGEVFLLLFDLYVFETWRWTPPAELPVAEYEVFE